jgi:hypothetical protein
VDKPTPPSWHGHDAIATDQRYWQRAKEAREKAAATTDGTDRQTWLEIAKGFERLAEQPSETLCGALSK